jgi:hypothetical protein
MNTQRSILMIVAVLCSAVGYAMGGVPAASAAAGTLRSDSHVAIWQRSEIPFGVMLPQQLANSSQGMPLVKNLGAVRFRPTSSVTVSNWNGTCTSCGAALQAGIKLVLTVANSGGLLPSSPPSDLQAYKSTLGLILDAYPPEVLAVENEENSALFYSGTPQQYGVELAAACAVAHAKGIPCTNGGLVSTLVALLVWDHYIQTGNTAQAQDFASRAFDANQQQLLWSPQTRAQIDKGKALLTAYSGSGMDYLNFHWYIADTQALGEAVDYLRAVSGLPVITNEVGQFNLDPNQTTSLMRKLARLQIPIAVWFGLDGPLAKGLVNSDGTLRVTGQAFKDFIQRNYR